MFGRDKEKLAELDSKVARLFVKLEKQDEELYKLRRALIELGLRWKPASDGKWVKDEA